MATNFQIINDNKYRFIPPDLRNIILKSGRKRIIFVEGYDDKIIFEILYKESLSEISFIDTSMKGIQCDDASDFNIKGGCEGVKNLLKEFVNRLNNDRRFYGVIDRDLREDEDIQLELNKPCYDSRLFIFFDRYTLENYFIETNILAKFLHGQSINHNKLVLIIHDDVELERQIGRIIEEILANLIKVGAANLTIRCFDVNAKFLEDNISPEQVEERVKNRLKAIIENGKSEMDIESKFSDFQRSIIQNNSVHKFASGKKYFSYQFNQILQKTMGVSIQLNNHKQELARILKEFELPHDFERLLRFLLTEATIPD